MTESIGSALLQAPAAAGDADAITCSGLKKRFGTRQAVDDVGFSVARGEIVGLLGPNGAGKSTVIKMLLGLTRPDAGTAALLGSPASDPASRRDVGYLPELFRYQPWLTPMEVLRLHVRLAGKDVPTADLREGLARVGLDERASDRVGGFSKGMQQRLGLAVALVGRPALVVLDEPTSALDPLGRADVRDIVLGLRADGVAVVLNSHLIGEVERVCDRVLVMDKGRLVASGTLRELLGETEMQLRLGGTSPAVLDRLARLGPVRTSGEWVNVALAADATYDDIAPDLVAELVALGVRVYGIRPGRMTLEDRLLGILRSTGEV